MSTLRKLAEVVALLTCIQEVPFSNLGQDTNYPDGLLCDFAHPFQTNASTVTQVTTASFCILSNSFFNVILPFAAV
jgi:hypothetical protein